ncbi:ROK family transcriptional regulator [Bacillus sp. V3B]|uniref:ROK family transcriptional regulator n=1 Tax=Bacillus sp. V3B TaxID=2804915 RepID=UPI00210954B5|nr:ROK family transcriptional regulator [Bacillus sp. V3B]MCQ6275646.1 ROK family transcriptional regulator [Bacillus sp. V3B]
MVTGDGAYIKKINRSIILETIIKHGMISRADLAKITGLNKTTISVQVADLLEEELIVETQQEHHTIGRRPIMLSINHEAAYVLGIDLDYKQIHYTLADLQGNPVQSLTVNTKIEDYNEMVHLLIKQIKKFQNKCINSRYGLVNVMIGIHGTVNKDEIIFFIPKYQWRNKNLIADLRKKLDLDIHIENNANLSAFAEKVYKYHESHNLINIILTSGIGAGIMINGEIHRGFHGYAGEMGHMIVSRGGKPCKCGNDGCWELYASEKSLLKQLSIMLNQQNITRDDVQKLLELEDSMTIEQLEDFTISISIGLNNIINLYNPETIVINSEILTMLPHAVEKIQSHLHSSVSQYSEIVLSELGNSACTMGACALAIQYFLEVPELMLRAQTK